MHPVDSRRNSLAAGGRRRGRVRSFDAFSFQHWNEEDDRPLDFCELNKSETDSKLHQADDLKNKHMT